MTALKNTQPAELRFTLQIKRAATGITETVEMVGHVLPASAEPAEPPDDHRADAAPINPAQQEIQP